MTTDIPSPVLAVTHRFERFAPLLVFVVVLVVSMMTITPWPVGVFEDDGIYTVLARSLATGEGFRLGNLPGSPNATHYPPGYPFVLSLLWRMSPGFPDNVAVFKFANAVFLALAALGTWTFARARLAISPIAGGAVAIASTLSIVVLFVAGMVLSEPLFLALLMPALLQAERAAESGDLRRAALAGAMLGGLALVRTLGALAVPAAVMVLLWRGRLRAALVLGVAAAAFLVPWQIWVDLHAQEVAPVLSGKFGAYMPWMREGYAAGGWSFAGAVVARNLRGLDGMLGYMLMPVPIEWPRTLAFLAIVATVVAGLVTLVRRTPVSVAFVVLYILTTLVWPFDANRFLWAIWPMIVLPACHGVALIWRWRPTGSPLRALRAVALGLALAPALGFLVYNARGYHGRWWASVQIAGGQQARPLVEWVARNTEPSDVVATERDLIVHLYTGRRTTPVSTFVPGQRLRPLTEGEDREAMREIVLAYEPRYVIVAAPQSIASAEALAEETPPLLRRFGELPEARIYERLTP